MVQRGEQARDVVEAELDAELFEAEEVVERVVVHEAWREPASG